MTGKVLNIQKFSVDDGPGIRTTVFFKGCNLKCLWCHNPESIGRETDIRFDSLRCVKCGLCSEVCPVQAQRLEAGERSYLREKCARCGKCTDACPAKALFAYGLTMTEQEVMSEIEKDSAFYEKSKGGVTFSGGEPMLQLDFLKELLIACKGKGFHTTVDTAGNVSWSSFLEILPVVDLFLFDVKAMDEGLHVAITGASNSRIQDNLRNLAAAGKEIIIRLPVIPGVNFVDEEAEKVATFLAVLNGRISIELLPFHKLGESKYESLHMDYQCKPCVPPDKEWMDSLKDFFMAKGLNVLS